MLKPVYDRVLIVRDEQTEQSKNGIFVPTSAVEKPNTGTIYGVGKVFNEDGEPVELDIKVGDRVLFDDGPRRTAEVGVDDMELVLINLHDILCVIEGE